MRALLTNLAGDITHDPDANMQWSNYFRNIITRYQVAIEGWPPTVPFMNLSKASNSFSQLEMLLRKWEMGSTYWKELSAEEYESLRRERNEQLESGELEEPSRRTRSDKGKKRARRPTNNNSRQSKKYKSAETVDDEDDSDQEEIGSSANPGANTTPAVQGTSAGNAGTISAAASMTALPPRGDVNASAESDDISTGANPAAGATTPAMANVNTLTGSNGTIDGTNVHPGGSTMAQTANSMVTQGSFDTDLFNDLEQSIFDFDGATISPF